MYVRRLWALSGVVAVMATASELAPATGPERRANKSVMVLEHVRLRMPKTLDEPRVEPSMSVNRRVSARVLRSRRCGPSFVERGPPLAADTQRVEARVA